MGHQKESTHHSSSTARHSTPPLDTTHQAGKTRASTADRTFELLLEEHVPTIFNVLRRRGVPESEREDVLQQVLLRAYQSRSRFDPSHSFSSWISTIAARTAVDHFHLVSARREVALDENSAQTAAGEENLFEPLLTSGEDDIIRRYEARRTLRHLIDSIPEARRRIFILHELEGHSVEEIGMMLKLPPNTVKSRLLRGRNDVEAAHRRWAAVQRRETSRGGILPIYLGSLSSLLRAAGYPRSLHNRQMPEWAPSQNTRVESQVTSGQPPVTAAQLNTSPLHKTWGILRSIAALSVAGAAGAVVTGLAMQLGGSPTHPTGDPKDTPASAEKHSGVELPLPSPVDLAIKPIALAASADPTASNTWDQTSKNQPYPKASQRAAPIPNPSHHVRAIPRRESEEMALLEKAKALLDRGQQVEGCAALAAHANQYPNGLFQRQRNMLVNAAACSMKRRESH
ncbi:MAG: RNA polymerase sigma factor [Polyangiaceae bacterium]|nr:RNA polymerase sigma factor [Polyangiaceae bacterium]